MITANAEGVLLMQTGDSPGAKAAFGEAITGSRLTGDNASLAFALSRRRCRLRRPRPPASPPAQNVSPLL